MTNSSKERAIFIDRDGTLNIEAGYITKPGQFRLYDFAAEALKSINESGRRAIVVTNQSGIARGYYDEQFLLKLHGSMLKSLQERGAQIDAVYYCPHHPEIGEPPYRCNCRCRKPAPGMLEQAAKEFNLDLKECFVIGDSYRDIAMGHAVGAGTVMVMTGHGREEYESSRGLWQRQPDSVAENLLDAVCSVISSSR